MFFFRSSRLSFKNSLRKTSKGSTLSQKKYIKIRQMKQAGFTLVELMIAVTLTSFITLAISSVFIFSVEQFNILLQQHRTEEAMLFASYHMRSYLSQAVNMRVGLTGVSPPTSPSCHIATIPATSTDQGFIVNGYTHDSSLCPQPIALVAIFPRENSFKYNTVDLFETSIFYERPTPPTATEPSLPGRLFFGLGTRTSRNTTHFHSPHSPNNIIYTGLSHFEIRDIAFENANTCFGGSCSSTPMIKTATVTLRFRYFLFTDGTGGNFYDYTSDIRAVNAREMENTIEINFHNNTMEKCDNSLVGCISTTGAEKERIFGPIYFYKLVIPAGLLSF